MQVNVEHCMVFKVEHATSTLSQKLCQYLKGTDLRDFLPQVISSNIHGDIIVDILHQCMATLGEKWIIVFGKL